MDMQEVTIDAYGKLSSITDLEIAVDLLLFSRLFSNHTIVIVRLQQLILPR